LYFLTSQSEVDFGTALVEHMKFVGYEVGEDSGLLWCYAVLLDKYFQIFQMHYKPNGFDLLTQCLSVPRED